jgi:hypothetical protein
MSETVAGYLFLCNNGTQTECLESKLFGLPHKYLGWVLEITKGTPLFLYNLSSNTLFGTFKASSQGGYNINPRAWKNMRPLEFPAQIMVDYETVHRLDNATKQLGFLRKNICKLSLEQTKLLVAKLATSEEYKVK